MSAIISSDLLSRQSSSVLSFNTKLQEFQRYAKNIFERASSASFQQGDDQFKAIYNLKNRFWCWMQVQKKVKIEFGQAKVVKEALHLTPLPDSGWKILLYRDALAKFDKEYTLPDFNVRSETTLPEEVDRFFETINPWIQGLPPQPLDQNVCGQTLCDAYVGHSFWELNLQLINQRIEKIFKEMEKGVLALEAPGDLLEQLSLDRCFLLIENIPLPVGNQTSSGPSNSKRSRSEEEKE